MPHVAPGADRVMVGVDVVAAVFVPHDHRDRVRLDDQIPGQPTRLVGGGFGSRLVWISDGNQVSHGISLPRRVSLRPPRGGIGE